MDINAKNLSDFSKRNKELSGIKDQEGKNSILNESYMEPAKVGEDFHIAVGPNGGIEEGNYGQIYNAVVDCVMHDQNISREEAQRIVNEKEAWLKDMYEFQGETNPTFLANQITTTDGGVFKEEINEEEVSPEEQAKITVTSKHGEQYNQVWYLTKYPDHVHFSLSNTQGVKGSPYHVGEVKDQPYYKDVCDWLDGKIDINGNTYEGLNENNSQAQEAGKTRYEVVDNEFNRAHYADIIGKVYDTPPSYAAVKEINESMNHITPASIQALAEEISKINKTIDLKNPIVSISEQQIAENLFRPRERLLDVDTINKQKHIPHQNENELSKMKRLMNYESPLHGDGSDKA